VSRRCVTSTWCCGPRCRTPPGGLARRDAGIDARWRLHDLRHWSATEAIGRGHDIRTVAGRLGHANPAMTLRTYAHALDGADAGVAATLATALEEDFDGR